MTDTPTFTLAQLRTAAEVITAFKDAEALFQSAKSEAFTRAHAKMVLHTWNELMNTQKEFGEAFFQTPTNLPASVRAAGSVARS